MKTWEKMRLIVKEHMEQKGIKQKFLAEKCGFDEKAFSFLINGKKQVTDEDIEHFCYGMGILPSDILQPRPKLDSTG